MANSLRFQLMDAIAQIYLDYDKSFANKKDIVQLKQDQRLLNIQLPPALRDSYDDFYYSHFTFFDAPTIGNASRIKEQPDITHAAAVYVYPQILAFFQDRLKVQQREAGVRHDLIDAVFALGGEDDLVRLLARVHALQAFVGTEDGANLLAGYKRAANILKKEGFSAADMIGPDGEEDPLVMVDDPAFEGVADQFVHGPAYDREPAEAALAEALADAAPRAQSAVAAEDFTAAMAALATLRGPIDAFFESVTVNDADANKRANRLGLLDQFRAAVHKVADFSRIEG